MTLSHLNMALVDMVAIPPQPESKTETKTAKQRWKDDGPTDGRGWLHQSQERMKFRTTDQNWEAKNPYHLAPKLHPSSLSDTMGCTGFLLPPMMGQGQWEET